MSGTSARVLSGAAISLLAAGVAIGCADPYTQQPARGEPGQASFPGETIRRDARPHPRGDERVPPRKPIDPAPPAAQPARDPEAAIRGFCVQFVNWSWRTIERQQWRLGALSAGRLRRQYQASAHAAKLDQRLADDRLAMRGMVVAIELDGRGAQRRGICVARQEQLEHGRGQLAGGQYVIYLAHLAISSAGSWAITRWEPQL